MGVPSWWDALTLGAHVGSENPCPGRVPLRLAHHLVPVSYSLSPGPVSWATPPCSFRSGFPMAQRPGLPTNTRGLWPLHAAAQVLVSGLRPA